MASLSPWLTCGLAVIVAVGCDPPPENRRRPEAIRQARDAGRDAARSVGSRSDDGGDSVPPSALDVADPGVDALGVGEAPDADVEPGGPDDAGVPDAGDPMAACRGVRCGGAERGRCVVGDQGQPRCECEYGFLSRGLSCVPACDGVECPDGKTCIPGHHGVTEAQCVLICDCSNCGNCEIKDFQQGVIHRSCGSPNGSAASLVCNNPCPRGYGCIPFRVPICWQNQGCFSANP